MTQKTNQTEKSKTKVCNCHWHKKTAAVAGGIALMAIISLGVCWGMMRGTKTMVVDFERVQQEAIAYKAIIDQQKVYEEKLQARLGLEAGALEQEEKELVERKGKLSEKEFKKQAAVLQQKAGELQNKYRFQLQQIVLASQLAASQIQAPVEEALQAVAKKAGAGVVLNKSVTIYAGEKNDLTDGFIRVLNQTVKPVAYPNPEAINPTVGGQ